MSTMVNTGWLNDKSGNRFAPKTLSSQVMTSEGITLENKIENELVALSNNKADKIHTHNWEDKPFGTSGEAIEGDVLYELTYDSEVTETSWLIGEYFLGMSITDIRLYLDDEAYDFVQTSATGVVQEYSNSDGMTITSYLVDWSTEFDLGEEKTFTTLKVVKIEESVNKMPIEYLPEHAHSWNDLNDKPFGEMIAGERSVFYEDTITSEFIAGTLNVDISPLNGKTVFLTINGNEYNTVCYFASSGHYKIDVGDYNIGQSVLGEGTFIEPLEAYTTYDIKIEVAEVYETKLPIEYLSEHTHTIIDIEELSDTLESNLNEAKTYADTSVTTVKNDLTSHTSNKSNPHNVTPSQLGLSSETWTFTLSDGSTVTKSVVVM